MTRRTHSTASPLPLLESAKRSPVPVAAAEKPGEKKKYPTKHLYIGASAAALFRDGGNASGRLENVARRFEQMVELATPKELSIAEWAVVVMALRDGAGLADMDSWNNLLAWAHVYEARTREIYGVDAIDVARKLQELGPIACVAAVDIAERYWAIGEEIGHGERLERLGLAKRAEVVAWIADEERRTAAVRREAKQQDSRRLRGS